MKRAFLVASLVLTVVMLVVLSSAHAELQNPEKPFWEDTSIPEWYVCADGNGMCHGLGSPESACGVCADPDGWVWTDLNGGGSLCKWSMPGTHNSGMEFCNAGIRKFP